MLMFFFLVIKCLFCWVCLNIFFTTNIIFSLLNLICCFILSSLLLFSFGLDYFSLILINIYVGAISVLFLFVLMMLNIKNYYTYGHFFYFISLVSCITFFSLNFYFENFYQFFVLDSAQFTIYRLLVLQNPIINVGIFFFFENIYYLILASFILFVAMLGSVVLVFEFFKLKSSQAIAMQISQDYSQSFFLSRTIVLI